MSEWFHLNIERIAGERALKGHPIDAGTELERLRIGVKA